MAVHIIGTVKSISDVEAHLFVIMKSKSDVVIYLIGIMVRAAAYLKHTAYTDLVMSYI